MEKNIQEAFDLKKMAAENFIFPRHSERLFELKT